MIDLTVKQNNLQSEANEVLKELELLNFLKQFGDTYIVGSLQTGLMTWPDIDIEVSNVELGIEKLLNLARYLLEEKQVKQTTLMDFRINNNPPSRPKGLYCGVKHEIENGLKWKIDIWLKSEKESKTFKDSEKLLSLLNEENKKIILLIKEQIFENPKYKKTIFSTDIYNAVLHNNVRNLGEFKEYLKQSNRML